MIGSRWWAIAVAAISVVCAAVIAASMPFGGRALIGFGLLAVFVLAWLIIGRRATNGDRRSVVFLVILVPLAAGFVAVEPSLAVFQAIAMPIAWLLTARRRDAIIANVAIVAAVVVGFGISLPPTVASLQVVMFSESVSLAGSIALGLWITRIAELSDERRALLDELTAAQDELAALHRDAGTTAERERLARELHDTIAQSLAGMVLLTQRSRRELATGALRDETLELVEESARTALTETRTLVAGSAPVELAGGLGNALGVLAERFRRETSVAITCTVDLASPLERDAEVALLRCAQEALANVRKHAGAASVLLELTEEGGVAELRVRDDGRGLDPSAVPDGFGLSGLRARLALVGGTLTVTSDGGTTVTARLPREVAA